MNTLIALHWLLLIHLTQPVSSTEKNPGTTKSETIVSKNPSNEKGYWVIHQLSTVTNKVLVYYYNEQNELVKKEWRSLEEVDIEKPKIVRSLKKSLKEALKVRGDEERD